MKKCAIVVAHADDEAIWCASLPLRYPNISWNIVCCSYPMIHPERAHFKFIDSCKVLGANARLPEAPCDKGMNIPLDNFDTDHMYLLLEDFDHIFTHNDEGEYGHPHHIQVHEYIKKKYSHKKLTYFGYRANNKTQIGPTLHLWDEEIAIKMQAIKCYNHMSDGKPYYEKLLRWMKTLPNYNLDIETFEGELPDG